MAGGEGALVLVNAGTIRSAGTGIESLTQTSLENAGTIAGDGGVAVRHGAFDAHVILKTGSAIAGIVDAGGRLAVLVRAGVVIASPESTKTGPSAGLESR